jgi:hypothetical protein
MFIPLRGCMGRCQRGRVEVHRSLRSRCAMDGSAQGTCFFCLCRQLKAAVIADAEATRAIWQAEVGAAKTMIERTAERFGLKPERLAADIASLNWLIGEGIAPHIPVFDKSQRSDGTFSRDDFRFDDAADVYICPAGKKLTTTGTLVNDGATLLYRGSTFDCSPCEHKDPCCPKTPARKISRSMR